MKQVMILNRYERPVEIDKKHDRTLYTINAIIDDLPAKLLPKEEMGLEYLVEYLFETNHGLKKTSNIIYQEGIEFCFNAPNIVTQKNPNFDLSFGFAPKHKITRVTLMKHFTEIMSENTKYGFANIMLNDFTKLIENQKWINYFK